MGYTRSFFTPPRPPGLPECAYFDPHVGEVGAWVRCRRRSCPTCGPAWVAMHSAKMRENLGALGGPFVLITLTAPGADVLPWACDRRHKHEGAKGCQVDRQYAREWADQAPANWKKLRDSAKKAVKRADFDPVTLVIERVWEPQKRGVPHLHVVAAARTPDELAAVEHFHAELRRLAPENGFGPQLHITKPMAAAEAARYLAGYLLGRSKKKGSIRENLDDPLMPRSLIWEATAIASLSEHKRMVAWRKRLGLRRGTGVTIRMLRLARWFLAALKGRTKVYPRLAGSTAIAAAKVAALLERAPPSDWVFYANSMTLMRLEA